MVAVVCYSCVKVPNAVAVSQPAAGFPSCPIKVRPAGATGELDKSAASANFGISSFYRFSSTKCVACSVALCCVTENPRARRSRPVNNASPRPSATGASARCRESINPACRYCRTVETPPPILMSLSPAACDASTGGWPQVAIGSVTSVFEPFSATRTERIQAGIG